MLPDPITFTLDSGATNTDFIRTGTGNGVGTFTSSNGLNVVTTRQTSTKSRLRREFRLTTDKLSADPLDPSVNVSKSTSVYLVIDEPIVGFSDTELGHMIDAINAAMSSYKTQILVGGY